LGFKPELAVFGGGEIIKGLMGPDAIADMLPSFQLLTMLFHGTPDYLHFIKLLPVSAIGPSHKVTSFLIFSDF